eukprot:CAMPEP_0197027976 /NCGR_PEP_ID=MMETSP1384-20130603/7808_1 /TAXON_ID=29189 /ORGANISM="Ammonia sp." /LENGTH=120 /DNA_ID=CAMNT_0042456911 /DNA_START=111 /DNA_END=473 /DNA_ORIENTATION=-
MARFFRSTKSTNDLTAESRSESADESHKKIIVKKDLEKIKWVHLKPKRGYRNGIYPKWSRLRGKVYRKSRSTDTFDNTLVQSIDKMRQSFAAAPVHPVQLTRSKSSSSVLPLRPPNGHDH